MRYFVATAVSVLLTCANVHAAQPAWVPYLESELALISARTNDGIGVYVRDLRSGVSVGRRAEQTWYLASTVKVPVAIAILRGIERGDYGFDTTLKVRASDYVDGAGSTNARAVGTPITIRALMEQMIVFSDNTASDMLIALVGIQQVNGLIQESVPEGFGRITSLADVRRQIYSTFTPQASHLSGHDFLLLKQQRSDAERKHMLARLTGVPASQLAAVTVDDAYDAYYAGQLNSGRLHAYGDMLALLAEGKLLSPPHTVYLLELMERVQTGPRRLKAGLPPGLRFAHKTGTQRARTCDSGIVRVARLGVDQRVVVVACTRGERSAQRSDRMLRDVGAALCRSGIFTNGNPNDDLCLRAPIDRLAGPDTDDL